MPILAAFAAIAAQALGHMRPSASAPIPLDNNTPLKTGAAGATGVPAMPPGTAAADLMVGFMGAGTNSTGTWSNLEGFTEAGDLNEGSNLCAVHKTAGGAEGASYTFTNSNAGNNLGGVLLTYRNAVFDVAGAIGAAGGGGAIAVPAITPAIGARVILALFDQANGITWPDIAGWTEIDVNTDANGPSWRIFGRDAAGDGTTTGVINANSSAGNGESAGILISIKPAP